MDESVEQIDPTTGELTVDVVKKRAVRGAAILTGRNIFIQAITFFSTALLTLFLEPSEYGAFFLVSAVINFLAYFGDIGFAAALIQRKGNLTQIALRTVFTIQQGLVIFLLFIVFIFTSFLKNFYNLGDEAIYLLWALAFSLFLSSLKTIPTVLMERKLEFNKWVIPQIIETIAFNATAIYLAWQGFGVTSFTIAVLIRGVSGLIITYLIQPWLPGFSFSLSSLKPILNFGIPYQLNTLLAMVKDDGMILFLGGILGTNGVGLLGWAQKWAYAPLRFFMDQIIKVTFPAFSRLQDNKKELSAALSKSIFFICSLVFPSLVLLILLAPSITYIIPKYTKWVPALTALSLISITSAFAAVTTPLTNMLTAIGKISLTFKFMMMWTILTWLFVPSLSLLFGIDGAALGFAVVGISSMFALIKASEFVNINYLEAVGKPIFGALLMGILVFSLRNILPTSLITIVILVIAGLFSYAILLFIIKPDLLKTIKTIKFKND